MSKGTRITFNSQFEKANGTWEVYNLDANRVYLGRVMKNGKLGTPNAANLLVVERSMINIAFAVGTARITA